MEANAQKLLCEVRTQLTQFGIPDAERFEANVISFLSQCPNDIILADATVKWDGETEFDFLWDTAHLDCRFSIGVDKTSWHLWVGINTHSKEDECFQHGIGGMDIEGNEDCFAYCFFESMEWEIVTCKRK